MYNNNEEKPFKRPMVDLKAEDKKKEQEENKTKSKTFLDVFDFNNQDRLKNIKKTSISNLKENENNQYEITNIESLADSIETLGLLQPLLVKKRENNQYEIVAGHRRYNAIKKLIEEDRIDKDYFVMIKLIEEDEDELITRLKLHETNLQTRSLLKLPEEEKLAIVKDYLDLIKQAKEQGIKIGGKEIKGTTREILSKRFNISDGTAKILIKKVKEEEVGKNAYPEKTLKNKGLTLKSLLKKAKTIEQGLDEEETKIAQEIIEVLEELM